MEDGGSGQTRRRAGVSAAPRRDAMRLWNHSIFVRVWHGADLRPSGSPARVTGRRPCDGHGGVVGMRTTGVDARPLRRVGYAAGKLSQLSECAFETAVGVGTPGQWSRLARSEVRGLRRVRHCSIHVSGRCRYLRRAAHAEDWPSGTSGKGEGCAGRPKKHEERMAGIHWHSRHGLQKRWMGQAH